MLTKNQLNDILAQVNQSALNLLGDKLVKVILFGSYARWDSDDESDVDIMIIAKVDQDMCNEISKKISSQILKTEINLGVVISVIVQDEATYNTHNKTYPFFKHIEKEGKVYVA